MTTQLKNLLVTTEASASDLSSAIIPPYELGGSDEGILVLIQLLGPKKIQKGSWDRNGGPSLYFFSHLHIFNITIMWAWWDISQFCHHAVAILPQICHLVSLTGSPQQFPWGVGGGFWESDMSELDELLMTCLEFHFSSCPTNMLPNFSFH